MEKTMIPAPDKIDEIFWEALQLVSAEERTVYLERACGSDQELRRLVEKLLRAQPKAAGFLEEPLAESHATVDEPITERPGTVIGPYKLMEQIGEGGMGLVFVAEQQQPIRRKVALKLIKPGMDTRQVIARFEAERQALALMDHPNIAKVLDAGQTSSGRPYFVMDLVKGIPITEYCDQKHLTAHERLELFVHICQAVQHAHQKGIIHRDIKPSNVLVTLHDGTPLVKVIDFGIAKALGQQLTDKTLFTGFAQLIGTPLYMSPEQAALSNVDVDTRSDIYSLGVVLYELLTGTTPFSTERLHQADYDEICRIIREEEPPKPSTRISTLGQAASTISTQRKSDPRKLSQLLRGDLDWMVMKALEKDRNRRYETASAFAADVQRYLHHEPVEAGPPSALYRFRKFARRNRAALGVAACMLLMFTAMGGSVGWAVRKKTVLEREASGALQEAQAYRDRQDWRRATAAARRAEAALVGGGSQAMQEQIRAFLADLRLLQEVDEARLSIAQVRSGKFDRHAANDAYDSVSGELDRAFREYGLPVLDLEWQDAAQRIARSGIGGHLVTALTSWANTTPNRETRAKLSTVARLADTDPVRQQILEAGDQRDAAAVLKLAKQTKVLEAPTTTLVLLANNLARSDPGAAVDLLRRAQERHPDDFWINNQLAYYLMALKPPQAEQAVRFYQAALALRPFSPNMHVNLGNALRRQRKFSEAEAEYRRAIEIQPDHVRARGNLGTVLADQGRFAAAVAEYEEAIRIGPHLAGFHNGLGNALSDQGKLAEAEAAFREAIRLEPDLAKPHGNLARVLADESKLPEAEAECRKAIGLDPDLALPHTNLGLIRERQGKFAEAEAEYRAAIRLEPDNGAAHNNLAKFLCDVRHDYDRAILEFETKVRLEPGDAAGHFNLANALHGKGRLDDAIAEYREALRLRPGLASAHNNLGLAYQDKGQLENAISEYKEATHLDPKNADPHQNLGALLCDRKRDYDGAIAEFHKAIALNPDSAGAHFCLGIALTFKGDPRGAVRACQKAIQLKPDYAEAHDQLGGALFEQGDFQGAEAGFRAAIRLQPTHALHHVHRGMALGGLGRFVEADAEYRTALHLQPSDAKVHNEAAWFLASCPDAKVRDPKRAVELAKKAVALAPKEGTYWNTLGVAHYRAGEWQPAVGALKRSMNLPKGGDSFDWFFLAMAHWQLGEKDQARQWYDRAVQWMDKNRPKDEELRRFRAEAAELLGTKDEKPHDKDTKDTKKKP
jgi:tetratricopeptide (TPR) repeat protein/serine/threonine protein kinase